MGYQKALTLRTRFTAPNNVRIGYVVVGRPIAYDANDAIPTLTDSYQNHFNVSNFLLGGKRITGNDVELVIPRVNWTANTIYTAYDDRAIRANISYVYASDGSVYLCLNNANNANSTIQPSGDFLVNNGFISPGDGYLWKYMYKIDTTNKYITNDWMPVPTEQNSNYFGDANNVVAGAIDRVIVSSGGTGYFQNNTSVAIIGAGVAATANVVVSNGSITSINVLNPGVRYTRQNSNVVITGAGTGASARLVLPPIYGHAYNPAMDLNANTLMIAVKIGEGDATEGGKITANNDFRQVALLMEPHKYGENVAVTIATANLVVSFVTQLILTSGSSYQIDELVYQGPDVGNTTFSGYVSDTFTNAVQLVGIQGTAAKGLQLHGATSGITRTVVDITPPDLDIESGCLTYVESVSPIQRSINQAENIKVILRF